MRLVIASTLAAAIVTAGAQDAPRVVADVARALGATGLRTIDYSGTGFTYSFGQNYRPDAPYPKFHARYSRAIDFENRLSREETIRAQFESPPRGGGNQPLYRDARAAAVSSDTTTWGAGAVALTPHGFVHAASAAGGVTMGTAREGGRTLTTLSFSGPRGYMVTGYVNAQNLIEKVETWMPNPILGDTRIETTYAGYRDFGGVQFPTRITQRQGGLPTLEIAVAEVKTNAAVAIQPPAAPQPARAEGQKVADGVWYLTGTPEPNSQLVEFRDYSVVIESSVSEGRALANIAEARRLVPGKPVRYHINSHHHGDHAAGVRAFVSEGVTIITHSMNRQFYEQTVLRNPHMLAPDALARNPRAANFIWVDDRHLLSDRNRTLQIYHVANGHAANLLMSYLPEEKLLFVTDVFNDFGEPRPNDPPPGVVSPYYAALGDRIRALKLDVERIAPSHGKGVVAAERLWDALRGTVRAPEPHRPS